jgi:hypothetical protein
MMDDTGVALALADLQAETVEEAMAEALRRAIGFVAFPPVVFLYENDVEVACCVDCFDGRGGTWARA